MSFTNQKHKHKIKRGNSKFSTMPVKKKLVKVFKIKKLGKKTTRK